MLVIIFHNLQRNIFVSRNNIGLLAYLNKITRKCWIEILDELMRYMKIQYVFLRRCTKLSVKISNSGNNCSFYSRTPPY